MDTWLVGCFGFNGPLRQYFSLYRAVSQREGERGERTDENKNVQTTPTRTYCKRSRPLPYCSQNCRTPRHWKFTQHHCTTRPPPPWIRSAEVRRACGGGRGRGRGDERRYENWNTNTHAQFTVVVAVVVFVVTVVVLSTKQERLIALPVY